jgi:collagen type VII alpha
MTINLSNLLDNTYLGFTGSKGDTGFTGSVGLVGSAGTSGGSGFTGSQGDAGFTGSVGVTGSQGDTGLTGSQGDTGFAGSQGDIGFAGSRGNTGFTGSVGGTGSQGNTGLTGSQGDIGFTGSRGNTGFAGSQGDTGLTGSQGDTGLTGSQGDIGFTGSRGDTGFTGSHGDTGFTGSKGDNGFTGSKGALQEWTLKTENYTLVDGDRIIADTSGGSFTVTLPATPSVGEYVQITDGADFSNNSLTVARNGSTIEDVADDVILDLQGATFEFIYDGTTWHVTATTGSQGEIGFTGSSGPTNLPTNSQSANYTLQLSDNGKYVNITSGNITVPSGVFSSGDVITIFNNKTSNMSIIQGASVTQYFAGTSITGTLTLSQRGLATILCVGSNTFVISGAGLF